MSNPATSLPPGFRFHPTDEELILHYLRNRAASFPCPVSIIAEVDIYKFDPWNLPAKALFGDREWYFFSPRDRKYPNGIRPNRAAASGYWKATGTDKPIISSKENKNIGVKKALVFYQGRPPKGLKTDWIMHEYRLAEAQNNNIYRPMKLRDSSMRLDDWVLCRIYKKSNHTLSMDPEQGEIAVEDVFMPGLTNTTPQNNPPSLPKSCSLTELFDNVDFSALSQLLENTPDMPSFQQDPVVHPSSNQPFINNGSSSNSSNVFIQQLSQTESPVMPAENALKRHRTVDSCLEHSSQLSRPSKRLIDSSIFTNFTSQFDSPQYNLIGHHFSNQQLLLNSNLNLR
ncbi:NAC domain-containing protein 2-like [Phoenix dactylifera]|uniref:NAC domain-containing protein 2-like n=1 Tax=Phoenix dactylifera TaxID=42345 RepID=A0A8B7C605_PHODC|nr:NAC domain-containing protein 2-like [Phoenix dactylifera]